MCMVDGSKSGFYCQCNANYSGNLCEVRDFIVGVF